MAQVYFHCSSSREVRVDQLGAVVSDLLKPAITPLAWCDR